MAKAIKTFAIRRAVSRKTRQYKYTIILFKKASTMSASDFFKNLQKQLPQLAANIANDVVVVEAEQMWTENFEKEGFTNTAFTAWQKRKKTDPKGKQRALLVKTGTLKGHALDGQVRYNVVSFNFPMEYMKVHNEGLKAGRGTGFTMPKRQFIGESKVLENRIKKKAIQLLNHKLDK